MRLSQALKSRFSLKIHEHDHNNGLGHGLFVAATFSFGIDIKYNVITEKREKSRSPVARNLRKLISSSFWIAHGGHPGSTHPGPSVVA